MRHYTRVLKNILHGQAISKESKKRRQVLKRIGAKIEKYMQNILGSKKIKIAIIPISSTLKGYAVKSSDIEYQIIILEGLSSKDKDIVKVKEEEEQNILIYANSLIEREGFIPCPMLEAYGDIINIAGQLRIIKRYEKDFDSDEMSVQACEDLTLILATTFLPAMYGKNNLLEKARKEILLTIQECENSLELWEFMRQGLFNTANIDIEAAKTRPHLVPWLKKQGYNNTNLITNIENCNRARQLELPSLRTMLTIYGITEGESGLNDSASKATFKETLHSL